MLGKTVNPVPGKMSVLLSHFCTFGATSPGCHKQLKCNRFCGASLLFYPLLSDLGVNQIFCKAPGGERRWRQCWDNKGKRHHLLQGFSIWILEAIPSLWDHLDTGINCLEKQWNLPGHRYSRTWLARAVDNLVWGPAFNTRLAKPISRVPSSWNFAGILQICVVGQR